MRTVQVLRSADRFVTTTDWATTRHNFSFGAHYEPGNVGFGPLMVSNDDLVSSGAGYDQHPHADAEIITWVVSGSLLHKDSAGHTGIVHRGLAQRMSAGSGIVHTERNDAFREDPSLAVEPVHFHQMWVRPDVPGAVPTYGQQAYEIADLDRGWLPVASGHHPDAVVSLGSAGSTLWAGRLAVDARRLLPEAPLVHLQLVAGSVELEGVGLLEAGDSVRLTGETGRWMVGREPAEVLAWEFTG